MAREIEVGALFGRLTVKDITFVSGRRLLHCQCTCGKYKTVRSDHVLNGVSLSCGCLRRDDITGQRFGRLVALSYEGVDRYRRALWRCLCDCKTETIVPLQILKVGDRRSCGCLYRDTRKKAQFNTKSKEYSTWKGMRQRCSNPKVSGYPYYGGRGIRVCEEWNKKEGFVAFLADMGCAPSPEHSIDRINPSGDYSPENCRWATRTEQAENRRKKVRYTYKDETRSLTEWARLLNKDYTVLRTRIIRGGKSFEDAISLPCAPFKSRQMKEYRTWSTLKQRCLNPRAVGFSHYGARGVSVCDRWRTSFAAFLHDMGKAPSPNHTIDRIDNSKGYEPLNCRWATRQEQARNRGFPKGS